MYKNDNTIQAWNKLAEAYNNKFMDIDLYNETYDVFCSLITKANPKIFEIACGPGNVTKYIIAKRPDFKVDATDVAPNMVHLAQLNNPSANISVMDCREINTINEKYDAIICGFCLPYLSKDESEKLIKDCFSLLNPEGIFYFSTIEGKYENSVYETSSDGKYKMFVYYYEETVLSEMLTKYGFSALEVKKVKYNKADQSSDTHLIFIAKK